MARSMGMPRGARGKMHGGPRGKAKKGTLKRLLSMLFSQNKGLMSIVFVCITISATTGVASSLFLKQLLTLIRAGLSDGLQTVIGGLTILFVVMGAVYSSSIICNFIQTRTMAKVPRPC